LNAGRSLQNRNRFEDTASQFFFYSIFLQKADTGIISEQGGIISTTATVARENGLPAVTGVRSARQIISDGDLIRIDGTKGGVQILKKALEYTV